MPSRSGGDGWKTPGRKVEGDTVSSNGAMGWYYHTCPKCHVRSRKRVLRNEKISTEKVELSKASWVTGGGVQIKEPFSVWVYSYRVEHECRLCSNRWVEYITKRRPW
ncbi:MAG: hypothetical protein JRN12_01395 [Nitrososphaerota archaeon]|nr:hypothetical protein [Nitrososphaerota archaeon]MDG6950498.1 hypothetical protein [Nitrososphaerota archaeon]